MNVVSHFHARRTTCIVVGCNRMASRGNRKHCTSIGKLGDGKYCLYIRAARHIGRPNKRELRRHAGIGLQANNRLAGLVGGSFDDVNHYTRISYELVIALNHIELDFFSNQHISAIFHDD